MMIEKPVRNAIRSIFRVKEKIFITPHYIRVVFALTDQQVSLLKNISPGRHNKIFIPASGQYPAVSRTYTTRHLDPLRKELWIDFLAHGDNGPASKWAGQAIIGDMLEIGMKQSDKPLLPHANEYLLAGDSTAIPVISAMLRQLPKNARAKVILEVHGKQHEQELSSEAGLSLQWVYNPHPEKNSDLAAVIGNMVATGFKGFVFVAAEYHTVRDLKAYFRQELALPAEQYSIVSYWTRGLSEQHSAVKRAEQRNT